MPQNLPNGITVPINSDAYNLAPDLATMGNSINPVIVVANEAARDALTAAVGMVVSRSDAGGWLQVCTNASPATWAGVSPYAQAAGYVMMPTVAAGTNNSAVITFPTGRFSQPPIMTLTTESFRVTAGTSVPTTTGATIVGYNATNISTGQPTRVHWVATQMTPTSSAG